MTTARLFGAALALVGASPPAIAGEWVPLGFGPANLATALDAGSVVDRGATRSAWFAISRVDLRGVTRLIRKERHEFDCRDGASRLTAWGDFYPDGRLAATGLSPSTAELKRVDFDVGGSHAGALWRAACELR